MARSSDKANDKECHSSSSDSSSSSGSNSDSDASRDSDEDAISLVEGENDSNCMKFLVDTPGGTNVVSGYGTWIFRCFYSFKNII